MPSTQSTAIAVTYHAPARAFRLHTRAIASETGTSAIHAT